MVKVKICGITNKEDAICAINYGVSALGFIFYRKSPRYIPPVKASNIVKNLPPFINRVGVFVDMNLEGIIAIIRRVGLSVVQLHGNETHEFCYELKNMTSIPIIKTFRLKKDTQIKQIESYLYTINSILLDTYSNESFGGTGKTFDWTLATFLQKLNIPIILSGGLNEENIIEAYNFVKPYALDVNSGVEFDVGIKDHIKIKNLMQKVSIM